MARVLSMEAWRLLPNALAALRLPPPLSEPSPAQWIVPFRITPELN